MRRVACFALALASCANAQVALDRYDCLQWRCIGPYRGGRTVGATGVPGQPNVFYIGVNNGGVWKTNDYGRTWKPIFDDQPTGSIGNLAIAPSNPNIVYVGSGEGLQRPDLSVGDGMYKSTDGGKTWTHLGLRDGQQINTIIVDPHNPDRLFVAVMGHPYGPNPERGVYRSLDGGRSFQKILPRPDLDFGPQDQDTGAIALAFDPSNSKTVYAALWAARQGPWENGTWTGTTSGLFKSIDGGDHWHKLTKGLPPMVGRIGFDVSRTNPRVLYATVQAIGGPTRTSESASARARNETSAPINEISALINHLGTSPNGFRTFRNEFPGSPNVLQASEPPSPNPLPPPGTRIRQGEGGSGIYRSDDGGESWTFITAEGRIIGRGDDFAEIRIHPKNQNVLFACNTSMYRSDDRGRTWTCIKGSPGGDDYHTLWINPHQPDIMLFAADQGAGVTVNGGETWSSWYNQPTAQFYHVSTDNLFPYNVYGGQQESGSAMVASRGNDGQITFREWHPVGAEEYGYVAADPLNPDVVYGGKLTRYHKSTGAVEFVRPQAQARYLRTAPVLFSPVDPRVMYFAGNLLFKTADGAKTWETISPDLSREAAPDPRGGVFGSPSGRRGVIYAVGPSYRDADVIWAGTDDGLVQLTRDGGRTWTEVTPPGTTAWSKVSQIDAGHFHDGTAYLCLNRIRLDDMHPHVWKTHDFGKTWTEINRGLPLDPINTVREDPLVPGLLYCGSERAVYFSADDGDHWNPLRLNMPATSIRDLVVHGDDLVVGTHGRAFWILDSMSLLRQKPEESRAPRLYKPSDGTLVEWNRNTDTPLPPDEPGGKNPPDGVPIDYWLAAPAASVQLEIADGSGKTIRRFSSEDKPILVDPKAITVMPGWARPPQAVAKGKGSHRFVWDMRLAASGGRGLGMAAIWNATPLERGTMVPAGEYTIRLIVDGKSQEQKVTLRPDPRISPR